MPIICSSFSNFSSIPIVFHWFFTWIALGDVDFSFMLARKANAVAEETKSATWSNHQRNQSMHVTYGMTVLSLSVNLLQKISADTDCLCRIALNQKLSHKFQKWCKFSRCIEAKSHKMNSCKTRPAFIQKHHTQGKILWLL
jgi:hypothetical protein